MPLMRLRGIPLKNLEASGRTANGMATCRRRRRFFKLPLCTKLDAATLDESAGDSCWGRWALLLGLGFWWGKLGLVKGLRAL